MVKEFHPDTIMAKGLPEEFIQFATQRFQEIQEAYESIRKERNFWYYFLHAVRFKDCSLLKGGKGF